MATLRSEQLPKRGIHLHAYNGPLELIPELVELGAYFSFHSGQLKAKNSRVIERIRTVPDKNLLIETDAPDILAAPTLQTFKLPIPESANQITQPANLIHSYTAIAEIRSSRIEKLAEQVAQNFETYFL